MSRPCDLEGVDGEASKYWRHWLLQEPDGQGGEMKIEEADS